MSWRKRSSEGFEGGEGDSLDFPDGGGIPLAPYAGTRPNPHILYGQADYHTAPVTFARIATRWGDVQLNNGWQNTNYGKRLTYQAAGYLITALAVQPGQTRLTGRHVGDFPARGAAPSQWDSHVSNGPGLQPNYPGGPGQAMGRVINPGSGG